MESTLAGDLFDNLPEHCPGCGVKDSSDGVDGPSRLMFLWQYMINSYICIDCNRNYTTWAGTNWPHETVKNADGVMVTLEENSKPLCLKNIEAIARGDEPKYQSWVYDNPMNVHQHP